MFKVSLKLPLAALAALTVAMTSQLGAGASLPGTAALEASQIHVMPTVQRAAHQGVNDNALPIIGCTVQCLSKLKWHGGDIQANPKVFITFWGWHGADPAGEAPYLQAFFNGVGGSAYGNIQTQYGGNNGDVGNPGGQLHGVWFDDSSTLATTITKNDVAWEGVRSAQHFGYDADANYFVATPSGVTDGGFGVNYCAYHGNTSGNVRFTFMPYMSDAGGSCGQNAVNSGSAGTLDGVSIVGGHEWAEAITDPDVHSGWFDRFGDENGDKCAWSLGAGAPKNVWFPTGTFPVQSLYSNAAVPGVGRCVYGA
jgi:hypothetical protein